MDNLSLEICILSFYHHPYCFFRIPKQRSQYSAWGSISILADCSCDSSVALEQNLAQAVHVFCVFFNNVYLHSFTFVSSCWTLKPLLKKYLQIGPSYWRAWGLLWHNCFPHVLVPGVFIQCVTIERFLEYWPHCVVLSFIGLQNAVHWKKKKKNWSFFAKQVRPAFPLRTWVESASELHLPKSGSKVSK